jgi:hypothetical protein
MKIQITKRTDGGAVLKCLRDDGTETWQKQHPRHAGFFALHDLTHYSVEMELGIRSGFYGLIASGWSIDETTGQEARGPIPDEALFVENVVGTFDAERASGSRWTAEEFNDSTERYARGAGRPAPRRLSEDEIARIRKRRAELFAQWHALRPGQTLELRFGGT